MEPAEPIDRQTLTELSTGAGADSFALRLPSVLGRSCRCQGDLGLGEGLRRSVAGIFRRSPGPTTSPCFL